MRVQHNYSPFTNNCVDFKEAYDSIERPALFMIMEAFVFPTKLIKLSKATLTDAKCKVLIQNVLSKPFNIKIGQRGQSVNDPLEMLSQGGQKTRIGQNITILKSEI